MSEKRRSKRGWLIYMVALCFLGSIAGLFLPLFGEVIDSGQTIFFEPAPTIVGGQSTFTYNGIVYSYAFDLNIPVFILFMLLLIGIVVSLTARNNPTSVGATMVLALLSLAFFVGSRWLFLLINPTFSDGNLVFGMGFYICLVSAITGFVIALFEFALCLRYWHKRDRFR